MASERSQTRKAAGCESTYVWNRQVSRDRRQVSGCQGLRKRGQWGRLLHGSGADRGDGCTTLNALSKPDSTAHFKWLNCMLHKFSLKLFKKKKQGWTNPDTEVLISRFPPGALEIPQEPWSWSHLWAR